MYGSLADANAYHLARYNTAWADAANDEVRNGALQKASDYIDATYRTRFPGSKTGGRAQIPAWPRTGAVLDGEEQPDDEIPIEIEYATYEAALLIVQGVSLNPVPSNGAVKRERVKAGPVESETEYDTTGVSLTGTFDVIDNLLEGILVASSGAEYELLRA